ncbi:DUF2924 domain-containing protein [Vannielia litorea]|uniref:DUF2924 domain-containing protein n=1 Tax=Vannielia litorea TaxID=1217970 RepID=UPI001BCC0316|nr:DUF2924 domain-containing protein [Vannielia litorea]MBS8227580.1 DUF2924 domain-containing protein [Vannielia litorea]
MGRDAQIAARWAEFGQMDRAALRVEWVGAFGEAPPHHLSMMFMRKALIWHAQCNAFGGLLPDIRRALKAVADGKPVRKVAATAPRPGSQLVREWNGRQYKVDVIDGGYVMNGERFASLSAIALHITGTSWSGPRFFALTERGGARP